MATAIIMPKAGMAMETGSIIEWKCAVGDYVETGDEILEIETDKVAMGVEAETSGYVLAITHQAGDVVPVTHTIGWLGEKGESVPEESSVAAAADSGATPSGPSVADAGSVETASVAGRPAPYSAPSAVVGPRVKATPQARRLAEEHQIDLATVSPSGAVGEVKTADVLAAIGGGSGERVSPLAKQAAERAGVDISGVSGSGAGGRVLRRDVVEQAPVVAATQRFAGDSGSLTPSTTAVGPSAGDQRTALSGVRKVIAQRMLESHRSIPPVTLNAIARTDQLGELRETLNAAGGRKYSYNDFLLLATARALRECPWMLVSLEGEEIVQRSAVNLGMAVAIESGLVVPVIHDAAAFTLSAINDVSRDLARRARDRKLDINEMQGGTFTVTNLGMYGITTFTPIINPPESAILGVGRIRQDVTIDDDGRAVGQHVIDLSLTIDHRLIDGAQGALFLKRLIEYLEHPATILV